MELAFFDGELLETSSSAGQNVRVFANISATIDGELKIGMVAGLDSESGEVGGAVRNHLGVGAADLAGLSLEAGSTAQADGADFPNAIAGGMQGGTGSFVHDNPGATTERDGWQIALVTTTNVAAEANPIVSDNFASEVEPQAVGGTEVRGNENGVGAGGKEANSLVDSDGGVGGHLGADGTKNAQGHAAVAHGENFAFAGQGDFAATDIKDASSRNTFVGNNTMAVEINSDIIIDEDVVLGDDVVAEGDLDFFGFEGGEELVVILDGIDVKAVSLLRVAQGAR